MKEFKFNFYYIFLIFTGLFCLLFALPFAQWILLAGMLAFALRPLQIRVLQKRFNINKTFSVYFLLTGIVLFLIPFFLSFISFFLEAKTFFEKVKGNDEFRSMESLVSYFYDNISFLESLISERQALDLTKNILDRFGEPAFKIVSGVLSSVPSISIGLFFFAASIFYFISDSKNIYKFVKKLGFTETSNLDTLIKIIQKACQGSLFAALMTGIVQATLISVVSFLLGADFIFSIFFITFFISQVPLIGTAPVSIILTLYFYAAGSPVSAAIMVGTGVLAGLIDNVVRAWMLNQHDSLHPLAGLISSIGALFIIGPVGVFLGPAMALVFIKLLENQKSFTKNIEAKQSVA